MVRTLLCLIPILFTASRLPGQTVPHPADARILELLDRYFSDMPSSSPGEKGSRTFRLETDTLYIEFFDPRDMLTGAPYRSEHRIPLKSLGAVRMQQGKAADGRGGLALEFIPESNLVKQKTAEENALSARSKVDPGEGVRSSDLGQRLAGRAAGVTVGSDNSPGGTSRMRIRGPASLYSSGTPLYLVDDVPVNNLNAINPDDIASVEVLKDASATAIYGMRGANGVVKVTTRKGDGRGEVPRELQRQEELAFSLWVFGEKARSMKRSGDDRRLADLLEYRAGLAAGR